MIKKRNIQAFSRSKWYSHTLFGSRDRAIRIRKFEQSCIPNYSPFALFWASYMNELLTAPGFPYDIKTWLISLNQLYTHHIFTHLYLTTFRANYPSHPVHVGTFAQDLYPTWEWMWYHRVFYVRQDWNTRAVVGSQENRHSNTKRRSWSACKDALWHHIRSQSGVKFSNQGVGILLNAGR